MDDWQKVLLGGVVGFVGGLAAEPLKAVIRDTIEARHAAKLLTEEIAMLSPQAMCLWSLYEHVRSKGGLDVGMFAFRYERYLHLCDKQKATLLKIKGYERLRGFYEWIARADGKNLRIEAAGNIIFQFAALHHAISVGELARPFRKLLTVDKFVELSRKVNPEK